MPGYKGHCCGAVLFFGMSIALLMSIDCVVSGKMCVQGLMCALLGALFPDIDTKSQGQKLFYALVCMILLVLIIYKKYLVAALSGMLGFIPLFVRHRGLFHSWWFALLIVVIIALIVSVQVPCYLQDVIRNGAFFLVGVYSHLVLDFGFRKSLRGR